jgi:hypothetical protein
MTRQHIGLLVVLVGTVMIGLSVSVRRQYQGGVGKLLDTLDQDPPDLSRLRQAVAILQRPYRHLFFEPIETRIDVRLLWGGLFLTAIGTLLQW